MTLAAPAGLRDSVLLFGSDVSAYRLFIIILDYSVVYWFTGRSSIALGFVLVSNIYTTVAYFAHERIWDRVNWGKVA